MVELFFVECWKIMCMFGVKVIVMLKGGKGMGMVVKVEELVEKNGWFLCW